MAGLPSSARGFYDVTLAPPPAGKGGLHPGGHRIALSDDRRFAFVLPLADVPGSDRLVVVEAVSGRGLVTVRLAPGARFGGLAVGPRTGRVFVVGQRDRRALVEVFDPAAGRMVASLAGRTIGSSASPNSASGDLVVEQAAVSQDEGRVFYSYTEGPAALAGLDWADVRGPVLRGCPPPAPDEPCVPGGGGFRLHSGGVLIGGGIDAPGGVDLRGLDGTLVRRYSLGLAPGFHHEFELDRIRAQVYAVGSCGHGGGLARLDLRSGVSQLLAAPVRPGDTPGEVCGERVALAGGTLVIGRGGGPPAAGGPGRLVFVDAISGRVGGHLDTGAQPVDVVAV